MQLVIALTILVYVQTHSGMDIGFGVSAAAMAMGLLSLICGTLVYADLRKPLKELCELLIHYPLEAISNVPFSEAKGQLLEAHVRILGLQHRS